MRDAACGPAIARLPNGVLGAPALAGLVLAFSGCNDRPLPPPVAPEDARLEAVEEFRESVADYRDQIRLLEVIGPTDEHLAMRQALQHLAGAIEDLPDARGVPANEAARIIRSRERELWFEPSFEESRAGAVKEALDVASGALLLAAQGPYEDDPELLTRVREARAAIEEIEAQEPLVAQRPKVLAALGEMGEALSAVPDRGASGDGA